MLRTYSCQLSSTSDDSANCSLTCDNASEIITLDHDTSHHPADQPGTPFQGILIRRQRWLKFVSDLLT